MPRTRALVRRRDFCSRLEQARLYRSSCVWVIVQRTVPISNSTSQLSKLVPTLGHLASYIRFIVNRLLSHYTRHNGFHSTPECWNQGNGDVLSQEGE